MTKRQLTLLVEFDNDNENKPDWIWMSHAENLIINNVKVLAIGEGDQMKDLMQDNEGWNE